MDDEPEQHDILPSLVKHFETSSKRQWIRHNYQLAYSIADRCASNVYDRQLHTDEKFDFLGMFQHSIAHVVSSAFFTQDTKLVFN